MKRTAEVQICLTTKVTLTDNKRETIGAGDKVIIQLFNSETENEDFDGFPAQEEDEDSELESATAPLIAK